MKKLTQEEQHIIEYVESGNAKSVDNLASEIARYKQIAKTQNTKRKAISIRLLESDLELIKAKAMSEGVPYQTLLSSLAHKYATGKVTL